MIKLKSLQKRLIKISIIAVVTVALLGAGAAAMFAWAENLTQEKAQMQSKVTQVRRDIASREEKAEEALKFQKLYTEFKEKEGSDKLRELNVEAGTAWIAQAGAEMRLVDLKGKFSGLNKPVANPDFKRKTLEAIQSNMDANIDAMTDEDLIRFVEKVNHDFPGYVKITSLDFARKQDITDEALLSVSSGQKPVMVSGKMQFTWLGVRDISAEEQAAEGGKNAR